MARARSGVFTNEISYNKIKRIYSKNTKSLLCEHIISLCRLNAIKWKKKSAASTRKPYSITSRPTTTVIVPLSSVILIRKSTLLPQPEEFLRDPNNWISCAVTSELHRRAKAILNDPQAPYKIARFAIENVSLGYIQKIFVKAFWSTKTALRHIQKINDKFNRSKKVELVRVGRNEAVVRLHWDHTMGVSKDLCLYNQGNYTFMPLTWGSTPLKLEEVCCCLRGSGVLRISPEVADKKQVS